VYYYIIGRERPSQREFGLSYDNDADSASGLGAGAANDNQASENDSQGGNTGAGRGDGDGWGGGWSNSGGSVGGGNHNGNPSQENSNRSGGNGGDASGGPKAGQAKGTPSTVSLDEEEDINELDYPNIDYKGMRDRIKEVNEEPDFWDDPIGFISDLFTPDERANMAYQDGMVGVETTRSTGVASAVGSAVGAFIPGLAGTIAGPIGSFVDLVGDNPFGTINHTTFTPHDALDQGLFGGLGDLGDLTDFDNFSFSGGPNGLGAPSTPSLDLDDRNNGDSDNRSPVSGALGGITTGTGVSTPSPTVPIEEEDDPLFIFRNSLRGLFGGAM